MFDMVVVDYADIMQPERFVESTTENSKSVYVGLRGLAMQEGFALLTATQTNRQGFTAAVAKAEHVADDFNKVRIADVIISINATEEEVKEGYARLYFAASRNQAAGFSIRIEQDRERMKFIKRVLGEE
jgi:replicative DNA helicase